MSMDSDAKEAAIHNLLDGYSSLRATDAFIDALLRAVEPFSVRVTSAALGNFANGTVPGRNPAYPPTVAEVAVECRRVEWLLEGGSVPRLPEVPEGYRTVGGGRFLVVPTGQQMPPGFRTIGPTKVSFGGKSIDLTGYTPAQKDWILAHGRQPETPAEVAEVEALAPRRKEMISHG